MKRGVSIRMPAAVLITALLVCAFGLAGCQNDLLKEGGTVHFPEGPEFDVTAEAVEGGVMLSWAEVAGLSFQVYRTDTAAGTVENLGTPASVGGTYTLRDIVREQNQIKPDTKYQYEVIGAWTAGGKDSRSVVKEVTTQATFPAKGEKVAAPKAVAMTMDTDKGIITATITPPDSGIIPQGYYIALLVDGERNPQDFSQVSANTYILNIDTDTLSDGSYQLYADSWGVTDQDRYGGWTIVYYPSSDPVYSTAVTYENLFGSTSFFANLTTARIIGTGADSDKLAGVYVKMNLNNIKAKQGAVYTFNRAEKLPGEAEFGDFSAVTLNKRTGDTDTTDDVYTPFTSGLTFDILGNLNEYILYDKTVSDGKVYQYQMVATKDGKSQTKTLNSIPIEQRNSAFAYITIEKTVGTDTKFDFTVDVALRDALKADDKLVLYWVKTTDSEGYKKGPYTATNKLEFTKTEMEVASPVAKALTTANNAGSENIFVQAYLEMADGTRKNISSYSPSGNGFSGSSSYVLGDESIFYFSLNY